MPFVTPSPTAFNASFSLVNIGTSDFVVASAYSGSRTPEQNGAVNGKVYTYYAQSSDGSLWELGAGVYSYSTHTLSRTTINITSNNDQNAVNFLIGPIVSVFASPEPTLEPPPLTVVRYDIAQTLTLNQQDQAQTNIGLSTVLANYLSGLTLSTPGGSTSFTVAPGSATDSTNADFLVLTSAMTKTISATWSAGNGGGALDIGPGNFTTWYHVFIIKRFDTGAVDILISLSPTAPTLPTNYTLARRIGSMRTDGSLHWIQFFQHGQEFWWSTPVNDVLVNNLGAGTTDFGLANVPPGVIVQLIADVTMFSAVQGTIIYVREKQLADIAPGFGMAATATEVTTGSWGGIASAYRIWTDTSQRISARSTAANTSFRVNTRGWFDPLGK